MPHDALTRRAALQGAAALTGVAALPAGAQGAARVKLRLLETSDLHVNVYPYDYYRDKPDDTVGLARTATLIAGARAQAKNALLFDNGDIIQGSVLGDYVFSRPGQLAKGPHPIIAAMNALDYVACTLGNHEFNYGLDFLGAALGGANFPVTCANIFRADGEPLVKPWLVVERPVTDESGAAHVLRIGVIGFVPPQIMQWDKGNLEGKVTTMDIVAAAQKYLPELRAQKVDLVLALCHSGISRAPWSAGQENSARGLAKVAGIDAMFLGHSHLVFPGKDYEGIAGVDAVKGTIEGVPAVMPGFWGSHLGIIDLDLDKSADGWKVAGFSVEARPIYERTADRKIVPKVGDSAPVIAAAKTDHDATLDYVRAPVGEIAAPIDSYFALVADDASVQVVMRAQTAYVAALAGAVPALAGLPILSAAAPFKSGGRPGPDYYTDIPAGPVAIKDMANIYLYPNTLRVVKIDGATVREWLERSAGMFNHIDPASAAEQPLHSQSFPSFNYDVIDGVTYKIDVTQPSRYHGEGKVAAPDAHRIVDLRFQGAPIDPAAQFLVVTNNYRADGGGHFPGCDGKTIVFEAPDANRDAVTAFIKAHKPYDPTVRANWSFVSWPESCVVTFLSAPAAAKRVPAGLRAEVLGDGEGGFVRFRLR